MKRIGVLLLIFIALSPALSAQHDKVLGDWYGIGEVFGKYLRITFHISANGDQLKATMDSPDQNMFGAPTDEVTFKDNELTIVVKNISLTYMGRWIEDKKIDGRILQGGVVDIPITLGREPIAAKKQDRPQEPKPPFDYKVEEVTFINAVNGHQLAGTLTLPSTGSKHPAVVLISGSGPQNRNSELADHKPFWVIADYLTKQGFAVLRYDDRGTGASKGDFKSATTVDFADDALAGFHYLKSREDINVEKIGLIGHSEGGMVAPVAASKEKSIGFIVLLAGVGTTGREVLETQNRLIATAKGIPPAFVEKTASDIKRIIDAVVNYEDPEKSAEDISDFINSELDNLPEEQIEKMGGRSAKIKENLSIYNTKWMRSFLRFNPPDYLKKVDCPVLALNGTLDLQVAYKENLEAIEKALKKGGNKQVTIKALEGLNHLFQHAKKGIPAEYGKIKETFDPETLALISTWLKEQL